MAVVAVWSICRDVITSQDGRRRQDSGARILDFMWLPPSCFCSDIQEGSQDCLETSLACSGDPSGTSFPRIRLTSSLVVLAQVGEGASLACSHLLASPLLVKVIRLSQHLLHTLCVCSGGLFWDLDAVAFWYFPGET